MCFVCRISHRCNCNKVMKTFVAKYVQVLFDKTELMLCRCAYGRIKDKLITGRFILADLHHLVCCSGLLRISE